MLQSTQQYFEKAAAKVAKFDLFTVVGFLTALVLLFNAHGSLFATITVVALLAMVGVPKLRRHPIFWLVMVFIWIPRLVLDWRENEDHVFFGIYWCMAIGLALLGEQPSHVLRFNARLMIGLSFTIATVWKLISPQFYEGELFHYKLLQDRRFRAVVTQTLGGMTAQQDQQNAVAIQALKSGISDTAQLSYPKSVSVVAFVMTYWTIAIEAALGLLFLLKASVWLNRVRNGILILFAITTYTIVPVLGFGLLFMTMGFANCEEREGRTKLCYLLTTGFLLFTFTARITWIQLGLSL